MKRKEKMVGFILGIITGAAVILSLGGLLRNGALNLAKKEAAAVSIIGGADGPTAIFIAGKIDFTPVYIGTAILVLITAGYMIYRKNKKGGS